MTVVVPAYQAEDVLARSVPAVLALDGIASWIWVDDGSTDETAARLRLLTEAEPRAEVLAMGANWGRGAARNAGIARATTDAVLLLDVDVAPPPDLATAMRRALEAPGAVASVAELRPIPDDPSDPYAVYLRRYPRGARETTAGARLDWRHFLTTAVAVDRRAILDAKGFDESVAYGEDLDLAARLAETHPAGLVACGAAVDLYGVDSLDGVLGRMRQFGGALAAMPPRVARAGGLDRALSPSVARRVAGSRALARLVRACLGRLPEWGVALGVRYLLAHALVRATLDASDRPA